MKFMLRVTRLQSTIMENRNSIMKNKIAFGKFSSEVEIDDDGSLKIEFLNEDDCWLNVSSNSYHNYFDFFFTWNNKNFFRFKVDETQLWLQLSPWFFLSYLKRIWIEFGFKKFEFIKYLSP